MQGASEAELEVVARWLRQTLMGSKAVRDVMSKKVEAPVAKKPVVPRMAMYLGSDSSDDEDEEPRASKKRKAKTAHAASKRRRAPSYEESSDESSDEPSD